MATSKTFQTRHSCLLAAGVSQTLLQRTGAALNRVGQHRSASLCFVSAYKTKRKKTHQRGIAALLSRTPSVARGMSISLAKCASMGPPTSMAVGGGPLTTPTTLPPPPPPLLPPLDSTNAACASRHLSASLRRTAIATVTTRSSSGSGTPEPSQNTP